MAAGTCQINDLLFSFNSSSYLYTHDPGDPHVLPAAVDVIPIAGPSGTAGFGFAASHALQRWIAGNGNISDLNLSFTVSVATPGLYIGRAGFTVYGSVTGVAGILAGENLCCPNGTTGSPAAADLDITLLASGSAQSSVRFQRAVTGIDVNKDLLLLSLDPGDSVRLDRFEQVFRVQGIPEPGVLLLTGGGIGVLLALARKRRFRRSARHLALLCAASLGLDGATLCTDTEVLGGTTLDRYIAAGACELQDVVFTFDSSSYAYSRTGLGAGRDVAPDQVTVQALNTPLNPGFRFVAGWFATGSQVIDIAVRFGVTAVHAYVTEARLLATTSAHGLGSASGLGSFSITDASTPLPPGGVLAVAPRPGGPFTISNSVTLRGNGLANRLDLQNNAHLSNLEDRLRVTHMPEPMTSVLIGMGLLWMGIGMRRGRHR
jgi:hypothetical protein